ncbi:GMC oxidoreductase [Mesorhizobium sp. BAC0120]|uniref:GMC oxidoreductase n=1 Tax=Mesorhizobium sp. BAC0120 TaxID=3090670 RepID=UPI00298C81BA|nr:GMC oxidoreductase [Mesorhizobium sp. BAC0120]MDW6020610.1 GMC oxidoreductase [Mesorhizobium sp. BAC0120]
MNAHHALGPNSISDWVFLPRMRRLDAPPAAALRHSRSPDLVGGHLLDHPAACVNVAASRPLARNEIWNYAGVLFARTEPDAPWSDIEIQLGPELFEQQTAPAGYPSSPFSFAAYFTVNRARSEGSATLASPDHHDHLRVDPAYFTDPDGYDMRIMVGGVRIARQLFTTHAMQGRAGAPSYGLPVSMRFRVLSAAILRSTSPVEIR